MTRKHETPSEEDKIPEDMLCPINKTIMVDPVIASDGHTYDREAIEQWLMRKGTSPNTNMQLEDKKLLPNYTLRKLIDEYLTDEQKQQRSLSDEAREKDPNSYDRQMHEQRLQVAKESLILGYSQAYEQLCTVYQYNEAKTEIILSLQELESILSQFSAFEWLLSETQGSLTDLLGMEVNVRTLVLQKLSYLNQLAVEYHMPIANYLQLDYQTMIACNRAMQSLCYLVAEKRVGWPLLLQLNQYEYDFIKRESNLVRRLLREHPWLRFDIIRPLFQQIDQAKINPPPTFSYNSSLTGGKALHTDDYAMHLVFSDPRNTDHLSVKQLVAALTKSPKEAVQTFLKVPGNVDKLFARISHAEKKALPGWGSPQSPGGLGPLRYLPTDSTCFSWNIAELSGDHLKGHLVYYERTKDYLPSIIKSLDDLKKVLEWLLSHQCKDVLERLRNSGQLNKLIKTPDDLAQLLNGLDMQPNAGLLIDFEASEFHPDVLYVGRGERRTVNYAFWPAYDQPVLRGVLSTTDVPELKDEKWLNSEHKEQFPWGDIRKALSHKHGIIFQNKGPVGVLRALNAKVAGEEESFLRLLLPNRWDFQQALRLLQPDRQEFLRQAMQPYLHLEPYQEPVLPPPPPTTHSNTVVRPSHAPRPMIRVAPAKPYNLLIYDRQKLHDAHAELKDTLVGIHGPVQDILSRADAAQAVRVCFPTLIDFKKFMSALSGYCSRSKKDLLYRTWREAIDENIHSIHDLFLVSQCLGDEGKALLYSNEHNKIMLENWRKAYPQVKDQYLMLLRAAVGYPGYKDEHAPCEQVSALRKVAACLMVFFWAFWTHLSPASQAEKQIRTLATSEPNFFTSPSKRAAAIFVDGLNERVGESSRAGFLTNHS